MAIDGLERFDENRFGGRIGRLFQKENIPQIAHPLMAAGVPEAVIAHLVEAGREDMLEKTPNELMAGHGFLAMAVGRPVLVAEGDGVFVDGQNAPVGDGDAEGVAGEVIEGGLLAFAPWRDMDDPGDLPDMARQADIRANSDEHIAESGAGHCGESRFGEQKGFPGGMPGGAVIG